MVQGKKFTQAALAFYENFITKKKKNMMLVKCCVFLFSVCVCVSYVPVVCVYVCICVYRTNWLFFFCISSLLLCFSIFIFGFKVSSCKYFTALPSILLSWHGLSLCLFKLFLLNFILVLLRSFLHLFGFLLFVWTLFLRIFVLFLF